MESPVLEKAIKNIDKLYSELLSAGSLVPDSSSTELNKLNADNLKAVLENAIKTVREIKSDLDQHKKHTPGTWNPPA